MSRHHGIRAPTQSELEELFLELRNKLDRPDYNIMNLHHDWDMLWAADRRPYYTVYPSLIPMLTKLRLDKVQGPDITIPHGLKSLSIRFAVGHELDGRVRTIWVNEVDHMRILDSDGTVLKGCDLSRGISLGIDYGEVQKGFPVYLIRGFPLAKGSTVEESLERLHTRGRTGLQLQGEDPESQQAIEETSDGLDSSGDELSRETIRNCVRLACTLCLIGDNPDLIKAEVLSKDRHRVSQDNIEKLVEKAKRRGKLGWSVGRDLEVIPHYRRPHPALVWTGKGRTIPKIILRAGSIVHREIVGRVPTGYEGDDGSRTEQVSV